MLLIDDVLISESLFSKYFACKLDACKGMCCVEGDYGAPLEKEEIELLASIKNKILPYLPKESQDYLAEHEVVHYFEDLKAVATPLHPDGTCIYAKKNEQGIVLCGIEEAYVDEAIEWKKPISCHLYPIRMRKNNQSGFTLMDYDMWDICAPACGYGEELHVKVYQFLEEPIVRAFGRDFYVRMEEADRQGKV